MKVRDMKVLFVHYEEDHFCREKPLTVFERVPFGISYISAVLKEEGHQTSVVVPTRESVEAVEEHIRDFDPGLVCFTGVYSAFGFLSGVAGRVKKRYPDLFLVLGGPHASLDPEGCLESDFDAVCVGEGEYPTLELAAQLEDGRSPKGIPNLYIKRGAAVERNRPRPFMEDLDSLPFPDRGIWLPWLAQPLSRPSVLAGRGCPFDCTYCCNHALRNVAEGKYVRLRSPESIVSELTWIKSVLPDLEDVYLEVETLGANRRWAVELSLALERMNRGFQVPMAFGANLRLTPNIDYEESGSERLRREVLKRNYSNHDVIRAIDTAHSYGLKVGTFNLVGIPGETRKEFRETVRLNRLCRPDYFMLSVFFPYPGTELYRVCRERGLLDGSLDSVLERRRPVLDLPGFSKRQIRRSFNWSTVTFNRGRMSWRAARSGDMTMTPSRLRTS